MIIFDLDGTLWDSSATVAESWNLLIKQETGADRGLTAADIARNMGKTMNEIADDLFDDYPEAERYALARRCEKFENAYITEHGGRLYPGVRKTLGGLRRRGVKMAIVSNCQEGYVKAFLDSMHMHSFFCDYEEWGRSGHLKADNIRLVMERNGEEKAIYVGDIQKDADAAHETGIPCIWAAYGFGEISDADGVIESFKDLPALLENRCRTEGLADHYAHRGYHQKPEIPENSMAAFRRAIEHRLPTEIDVHLIADGSLVVFHDEFLERETGARGEIEDYDITNLRKLRLEGTDEMIPTFDEVLGLYENTGLPLLIELKVNRGNYKALTEAVCRRLDSYKGPFALQSFDPRVLFELRRLRPEFTRGQLSKNFFAETEGLPFYQVALLTNMMLNFFTKPDFINYKFTDRGNHMLRWWRDKRSMTEASWTLRSADELKSAIAAGCTPIFENISPEELKEIFEGNN